MIVVVNTKRIFEDRELYKQVLLNIIQCKTYLVEGETYSNRKLSHQKCPTPEVSSTMFHNLTENVAYTNGQGPYFVMLHLQSNINATIRLHLCQRTFS